MSLVALNNQEPVTAVRFIGSELLLAGAGSFVKAYSWHKGTLLSKKQVFPVNKVHGIIPIESDTKAIAWGGNNISLLSRLHDPVVDGIYTCKDRIVSINVLNNTDVFVLTAHNEVLELKLPSMTFVKAHKCSERSILYSGSLYLSSDRIFAAAGTVFGGVVVWDLSNDSIYKTFNAHEGSIFDVAWSEDGRYLASCSDDRAVIVSELETGKSVAYGWGHVSRIWKVKFVSPECILSISEDCSVRVWKLDVSKNTLDCVRIMTGHQGRSVWSLDVLRSENVVSTGGGDGKIMLWDLDEDASNIERWNVDATFESHVRSCAVSEKSGVVVASCKEGQVYSKHTTSKEWNKLPEKLGPVPVVKTAGSVFYALSSNGSGMFISQEGNMEFTFQVPCKILDFFVLNESKILVIPTPPSTNLLVVNVSGSSSSVTCSEVNQKPGMGVITCASVVDPASNEFCVGSRNGVLALYSESNSDPLVVIPAALDSKNDAITALKVEHSESQEDSHHPQPSLSSQASSYIIASARSSDYGVFSLPNLRRLFKNRARKRGSIEGLCRHPQGLILWGFQKDLFLAWNATLGFEMVAIDCGGPHRAWSCAVLQSGLCLSYVRNTEIIVQKIPTPSSKFERHLLQHGTHGREIRGMELCPSNPRLLATASEDTVVTLSWVNSDSSNVLNACSVNDGHVSGIQCLHWDPSGKYLFTGAGNGELVMWEVSVRGDAVFANEASRMPIKIKEIRELRVMDFSVQDNMVAVAFSDSSFRIWRLKEYTENKFIWDLLVQEKYGERCLLNIDLFEWCNSQWVSMSSTDGFLNVYEMTKFEEDSSKFTTSLILRKQLHQSNIRCSQLVFREDGAVIHYSGGDDNAIRAVEMQLVSTADPKQISAQDLFFVPGAHSSAVTSVNFLPHLNKLATTGSDQKVKIWSLDGKLESMKFTDVSDTGVMVANENRIITAGIGLEFFAIS